MKKTFLLCVAVVSMMLIFSVIPIGILNANPGNLVSNGDFSSGNLTGWSVSGSGGYAVDIYNDGGNNVARIVTTSSLNANIYQDLYSLTNNNLSFSCRFKPVIFSGGFVNVFISLYSGSNFIESVDNGKNYYPSVVPTDSWTTIYINLSNHGSFDHIKIVAFVNGTNDTVYFDDFTLTENPSAAPSRPLTPQEQVLLNLSLGQQADLYGRTTTGFVKTLYDNILGRVPDDNGLNNWVTALNDGTMEPKDVVYNLVFSTELQPKISSMSPEEFVTFLYKNVFNREPDSSGYANWVSILKSGKSKLDVLLLFLDSSEFKNICEMFGLKPQTEVIESNIADKVVALAQSQIGKKIGDGSFAGMIWADSNYTYCDRFVSAVVAIASGKNLSERKAYPTAYNDYLAQSNLKSGNPSKGAIVYFDKHAENSYSGHVGISDGKGNIISVESTAKGITSIPINWFKAPLLGWIIAEERK